MLPTPQHQSPPADWKEHLSKELVLEKAGFSQQGEPAACPQGLGHSDTALGCSSSADTEP